GAAPRRRVAGPTWGGWLGSIDALARAGRMPSPEQLEGRILLLEASEERPPADWVSRWVRGLGERGILAALAGVVVARPPVSDFEFLPSPEEADALRTAQRDAVLEQMQRSYPAA